MKAIAVLSTTLAAMLAPLLPATPAGATVPIAWVASNGLDTNPCTRSQPCLTFTRAVDQADAGGEVSCVDAVEDFGPVNIFKSVTIDCTGTFAGIRAVLGGDAVRVHPPGGIVVLRGLLIDGQGVGNIGVHFFDGVALTIANCVVSGFRNGGGAGFGHGIKVATPAGVTSKLSVSDSVIAENGLAAGGGGIIIQVVGSGSARVVLNRVQMKNNTHGVIADGAGSTGPIVVQVRDSVVSSNTGNGITAMTSAGASATGIVVDRSSAIGNAGTGFLAQGSGALVHLGKSTVVGNGACLNAAGGGNIFTHQNNQPAGNPIDGAPTGVLTVN
jgi:hypothetical protein